MGTRKRQTREKVRPGLVLPFVQRASVPCTVCAKLVRWADLPLVPRRVARHLKLLSPMRWLGWR